MTALKSRIAAVLAVATIGGFSSAAFADPGARVICFNNAMTDGYAAAVQVRPCDKTSYDCGDWANMSLPHGDTESMHYPADYDDLGRIYFEYTVQGGGPTFFRGSDTGSRTTGLPITANSCNSANTVVICGDADEPRGTNSAAASTDQGCR